MTRTFAIHADVLLFLLLLQPAFCIVGTTFIAANFCFYLALPVFGISFWVVFFRAVDRRRS
jgi:hypothetical protein